MVLEPAGGMWPRWSGQSEAVREPQAPLPMISSFCLGLTERVLVTVTGEAGAWEKERLTGPVQALLALSVGPWVSWEEEGCGGPPCALRSGTGQGEGPPAGWSFPGRLLPSAEAAPSSVLGLPWLWRLPLPGATGLAYDANAPCALSSRASRSTRWTCGGTSPTTWRLFTRAAGTCSWPSTCCSHTAPSEPEAGQLGDRPGAAAPHLRGPCCAALATWGPEAEALGRGCVVQMSRAGCSLLACVTAST